MSVLLLRAIGDLETENDGLFLDDFDAIAAEMCNDADRIAASRFQPIAHARIAD